MPPVGACKLYERRQTLRAIIPFEDLTLRYLIEENTVPEGVDVIRAYLSEL